jgi:hypothetical protein
LCGTRSAHQLYQFVFLCRPLDPQACPMVSNETLDVSWFAEGTLPVLDPGHARRIADAFQRRRGKVREAIFDAVASEMSSDTGLAR